MMVHRLQRWPNIIWAFAEEDQEIAPVKLEVLKRLISELAYPSPVTSLTVNN